MALGGEMGDDVRLELGEQAPHERAITDVAAHEAVARVVGDLGQRFKHAGVGQLVEIEHLVAAVVHQVPDERRPDESGPSSDEYAHAAGH